MTADRGMTVPVVLDDYFYERITREDALQRLRGRPGLGDERRRRIEDGIPEYTDHYLTFKGNAFREYVKPSDEDVAYVLLLLRMFEENGEWVVPVPIYNSERRQDGSMRPLIGIERHVFSAEGDRLREESVFNEGFRRDSAPVELMVDTQFVSAEGHPGGTWCCDACEWVHSTLHIHCADYLCCGGGCPEAPAFVRA